MAGSSNIEWTDATWNPVVGCSIVSPGCTNCYAMRMAARLEAIARESAQRVKLGGTISHVQYLTTTKNVNGNAVWSGHLAQAPDSILLAPLHWRKPRRVFVNSMGDLFHEDIPDEWIDQVFAVMALCSQHTFQVLTKRAERMRAYFEPHDRGAKWAHCIKALGHPLPDVETALTWDRNNLSNAWLGISAERQQEWDERRVHLRATPAAVRFVSFEPLLGPINASDGLGYPSDMDGGREPPWLDWVIVGGESGHNARPIHFDWARSLRDQCAAVRVPFFFKQWGEHAPRWPGDRSEGMAMERVGKKRAGRLLDGKEHNEFPSVQQHERSAA